MAVTAVEELWEEQSGEWSQDGRRFARVFQVTTDDKNDTAATIRAASGLPAEGDAFPSSSTVDDEKCRARRVRASRKGGSRLLWIVSVEYDTSSKAAGYTQSDFSTTVPVYLDNPLARPTKVVPSQLKRELEMQVDIAGKPVLNSAGQRFPGPVMREETMLTRTFVKNFSTWSELNSVRFNDTINADTFYGVAPRVAKVNSIDANPVNEGNLWFWQVSVEVIFKWDTWDRFILDEALGYTDPATGQFKVATDPDGVTYTQPVLLDGAGNLYGSLGPEPEDAYYIQFQQYRAENFNEIGLGV